MKVKGSHTFEVSQQQLWDYLMNPDVLAKITPGVSQLEVLGDDEYKSISDIKIGPVRGSFKGKLSVVDKTEPSAFTIKMDQKSKIGNADATVKMEIAALDENQSELKFDGKAKLSGVIARTGQRVLSGVANTITKEVFASLEKHIEEEKAKQAAAQATTAPAEAEAKQNESLWTKIVNFFKNLFK